MSHCRGDLISGESRGNGGGFATVLFLALFIPAGVLLSKMQERKQVKEEKEAFRRLGMDWSQRARY